jgi:hypothetical protein
MQTPAPAKAAGRVSMITARVKGRSIRPSRMYRIFIGPLVVDQPS